MADLNECLVAVKGGEVSLQLVVFSFQTGLMKLLGTDVEIVRSARRSAPACILDPAALSCAQVRACFRGLLLGRRVRVGTWLTCLARWHGGRLGFDVACGGRLLLACRRCG